MDKDYLVTKSNFFIMNSHYDLSFQEQKIILTLASMVQPEDTEFKEYKFKIKDFIKLLGLQDQSKYTEVPKITKELMKKVFEIKEGKDIIQLAWLSSARYKTGEGTVILKFDSNLKPYMLQLNTVFTNYKLANILSMKSKYSPRIYEILKCNEFKKQGYIEIELSELRKILKIEKIYPLYNDLKRKIIEKSQKELKKLTDISFEFEEIKTGRKVTSIKFYIYSNKAKVTKESLDKVPITAVSEISATLIESEEEPSIKKIMLIMAEHNITALEAKKICDSSEGNINIISKVYQDKKDTPTKNGIVGLMISLVKPGVYIEPKKTQGKGGFNDFEQRAYDFDDLEKKLLGWDNKKNEDNGQEYQQLKVL